jgi:hypothetical protein
MEACGNCYMSDHQTARGFTCIRCGGPSRECVRCVEIGHERGLLPVETCARCSLDDETYDGKGAAW